MPKLHKGIRIALCGAVIVVMLIFVSADSKFALHNSGWIMQEIFHGNSDQKAASTPAAPAQTPTPRPTKAPNPASTQTLAEMPAATEKPTPIPTEIPPVQTTTVEITPAPTESMVPTAPIVLGPSISVRIGNESNPEIALTFDDSGENLGLILDFLNSKGIKGTFFLLAGELIKNPERWQQAVADGHLVCNHTVNHNTDLAILSDDKIRAEVLGWEDAARAVLGDEYVAAMKRDFAYFRSPGGKRSARMQQILGELGYTHLVYWTVEDVYFSYHNPENISMAEHYTRDAQNGAIFLMHSGCVDYLEQSVANNQENGYTFVTLAEVLN